METATQISEDQLAGLCEKLRECERTKDWDTAHDVLLELYNYHPTMKAVASCKIGVFLVHLQKIAPVRVKVHAEVLVNKWKQFAIDEGIHPAHDHAKPEGQPHRSPRTAHPEDHEGSCKTEGDAGPPHPVHHSRELVHQARHTPYPADGSPNRTAHEDPRAVMVRRLEDVLRLPVPEPEAVACDRHCLAVQIESALHDMFEHELEHELEQQDALSPGHRHGHGHGHGHGHHDSPPHRDAVNPRKLHKFGQLMQNLGKEANGSLRQGLLSQRITPWQLLHMSAGELGTEEDRAHRREAQLKGQREHIDLEGSTIRFVRISLDDLSSSGAER